MVGDLKRVGNKLKGKNQRWTLKVEKGARRASKGDEKE